MLTTHKSGHLSQDLKVYPTDHSVSQFGRESELISVVRTDHGNLEDQQDASILDGGMIMTRSEHKTEEAPIETIVNESQQPIAQLNISQSWIEGSKLSTTQRVTPQNMNNTDNLDFLKDIGKESESQQDLRMTSPTVPKLNLGKLGVLSGSQRRLKSKGSLTLSRATLSQHQRKMSLKYKQAYHEELLERNMSFPSSPNLNTSKISSHPSKADPKQLKFEQRVSSMRNSSRKLDPQLPEIEEVKNKKSTFSEVVAEKEEKDQDITESRFSEKPTMKIGQQEDQKEEDEKAQEDLLDVKEIEDEEKDIVPSPRLGDNLIKNKATIQSLGQFSIGHSSDDQKSNSLQEEKFKEVIALPEMSKSEGPKGIASLFHKRDKSENPSEKSKPDNISQSLGIFRKQSDKPASGMSLGSFLQSQIEGGDQNSPFKLLEILMNKKVVQNLIDGMIASVDEKFGLKKKYVNFSKILYKGFQLLFQDKQSHLQVMYWILDCKQDEFIIELGKVYRFFDKSQRGVLVKDSFQAWIRIFVAETNPMTVAQVFGLFEDESDKGQKKRRKLGKKNNKDAEDEVVNTISSQMFRGGVSFIKFTQILPYFMLYFLTRVLMKIKRRRALFHTVLYGDPGRDERGLNSLVRQAIGASNVIEIRVLQHLIMDFYKVKTELTSNNLYAITNSLKKNFQQNEFEVIKGTMLVYGDPEKPSMRHISTWLPFNIAMQLIASELDQCEDQSTFLSSYGIMQEEKFLESSVFSIVMDEDIIRPTILREIKQYINAIHLKEIAKQTNMRGNSKMKALTLLRSKTKKEALAKTKIEYRNVVSLISYCYPSELQFLSGPQIEAMTYNYFYSLLYRTTRVNAQDVFQNNKQIDTLQIIESLYTQQEVKTLALTLPLFTALLYLEQIQLKLYKGGDPPHPFYPYDYDYPEDESEQETVEQSTAREKSGADRSHSHSRIVEQKSSVMNTGAIDQLQTFDTMKKEMSENSKTIRSKRVKGKGKKEKKKDLMKSYIFLNKYFDEYQTKLMKEFNRKKKENARAQEVKQQAGLDSSRLQVRTPTKMNHINFKDDKQNKVLIRPQKFLHEKVDNLQLAMRQAWNDEKLKDQVKIKKLEQASKQLVFKWTRKGENNIAATIKNKGKTNQSITFGAKSAGPEKKRMDCSCVIF